MTRIPSPPAAGESVGTLIDALIREQQTLSAVESFSAHHDATPAGLESSYRHLIPLTAPRPGEQYGFEVDLDRCSGCKGCVTACHSLNGLEEGESWRQVGLLVGETIIPRPGGAGPGSAVLPVQRTVTTACHHCLEPACLLGCPVLAYDKEPTTGIVRHLDDQCIGCSYCVMTCPYEVPRYSAKRGIVRKCDLCHGRLAEGEAPACVQGCPNQAIRVSLVSRDWVRMEFRPPQQKGQSTPTWLPDSPNPQLTLPTTRYVTRHPEATLLAADHAEARLQPAHWPLILLLLGTQAGIGGMMLAAVRAAGDPAGAAILSMVAMACFGLGMIGSVAHLGQPAKAWRVWMGWRTSWLSREAMILPVFGGASAICTAGWIVSWRWPELPLPIIPPALPLAGLGLTGLASLIAQCGVYAATQRWCWRVSATMPRFLGTVIVLGSAMALASPGSGAHQAALLCLLLGQAIKMGVEVRSASGVASTPARALESRRQVQLLTETLRPFWALRVLVGLIAGVLLPVALLVGDASLSSTAVVVMVAGCVVGEALERWMFFRAATPNRMPGMP